MAIVGAVGIGFDVAEALTHTAPSGSIAPAKFYDEWGFDVAYTQPGGLRPTHVENAAREVYLLQRKTTKVGDQLSKTTGWIHRAGLAARGVRMSPAVQYRHIDDAGLHVSVDGKVMTLDVDHMVLCAGQEPLRELHEGLTVAGCSVHLIGGADVAAELDAKRAIAQGTTLSATL